MRAILLALFAAALGGCATPVYPTARPLTQAHIDTIGPTPVVVVENNNGVEKSWFFTSTASAGAAYGLVGALVSATLDAIINAGPSARASKAADEMAELIPVDTLNTSLAEQIRLQVPTEAPAGVSYSEVRNVQRLTAPRTINDAVEISTRYTLSEDASTLRVIASASYLNPETPYTTQYQFEGSPPSAEREGPAYRNTFTYYSNQLPVPTLTPELRDRLVASIQDSARDANGALPVQGSDGYSSMMKELENARDDNLSKDEIAIFLTREWLRDNGALLRQEVEQSHQFIARYVALDMNNTAVPSLTGQDQLLETLENQRTVRRIGAGVEAGSYVSSAANVLSFATYGNTISIAEVHEDRMEEIREAAETNARRRTSSR